MEKSTHKKADGKWNRNGKLIKFSTDTITVLLKYTRQQYKHGLSALFHNSVRHVQ